MFGCNLETRRLINNFPDRFEEFKDGFTHENVKEKCSSLKIVLLNNKQIVGLSVGILFGIALIIIGSLAKQGHFTMPDTITKGFINTGSVQVACFTLGLILSIVLKCRQK